ncbi:hypothetical protein, partial [Streptomyces sp. OM5714]|uniref:hypothetical protein n=1 Tax=Streptomyces sp. OM5714 TaxID=2602736 RepID=UPI001969A671
CVAGETKVMPVARLRHRTAVASTRAPSNQGARARMLPTALWPGVGPAADAVARQRHARGTTLR